MKNVLLRFLRGSVTGRTAYVPLAVAFAPLLIVAAISYAQQLEVKLVTLNSPVSPGHTTSIVIETAPHASCQISVQYKSGPSKAKGLVPKRADSEGQVNWTWWVGARTTRGVWPITVTCSAGALQGTLQTALIVQ